jgi:hypothetical protein
MRQTTFRGRLRNDSPAFPEAAFLLKTLKKNAVWNS